MHFETTEIQQNHSYKLEIKRNFQILEWKMFYITCKFSDYSQGLENYEVSTVTSR